MKEEVILFSEKPKGNFEPVGCARCGHDVEFVTCESCGGDGHTGLGELYEQDPLWYDPDDIEVCQSCLGSGGDFWCVNTMEYCESNPIKGREDIRRGVIEWRKTKPQ